MRCCLRKGPDHIDLSRVLGRRRTMTIGGALFIVGAALQAGAVHLAMLIVGRVMLGLGVGLANQVRLFRTLQCWQTCPQCALKHYTPVAIYIQLAAASLLACNTRVCPSIIAEQDPKLVGTANF